MLPLTFLMSLLWYTDIIPGSYKQKSAAQWSPVQSLRMPCVLLVLSMTYTRLYLPLWRYILEYLPALGIDLRPQ